MAKTKTTNQVLFDTIRELKKLSTKTGVNVFQAVAAKLAGPASQRSEVNLSLIEKYVKEGETIIVPSKILSTGTLTKKKLTIVGFKASESAIAKIEATGSKFIEIRNYISKKPDTKIRIIG